MQKVGSDLHEKLKKIIHSMGYEFVGYEMLPMGRSKVFRIFIDSEKGLSLDDCALVSRQIGAMMDVEEQIQGRYTLEVSSPGIDRPLFELAHYEKYLGCRVKIKLTVPIETRRQYKGTLLKVIGEDIHLLVDETEHEVVLPFSAIEKANLIKDIRV